MKALRQGLLPACLILTVALLVGCSSVDPFSGYNPEDPVYLQVVADPALNTYGGGAQSLDLYLAQVQEQLTYEGADISDLRKAKQTSVPGGRSIRRIEIAPGETRSVNLGPMTYDHFTHIGAFAAYGQPSGEPLSQVRAAEIPSSGRLVLKLGPNSILQFIEDSE